MIIKKWNNYSFKDLKTWAGRSSFSYAGNVSDGTLIRFGKSAKTKVTKEQYNKLLSTFRGKTVNIGTSRDTAPKGSLGSWLQENVTHTAIASYVGAILVEEGYARKAGSEIIFNIEEN